MKKLTNSERMAGVNALSFSLQRGIAPTDFSQYGSKPVTKLRKLNTSALAASIERGKGLVK